MGGLRSLQHEGSLSCGWRVLECGLSSCEIRWLWDAGASVAAAQGLPQLQLVGSGVRAPWSWSMGLAVLRRVISSWTRDRTRAPCIRILTHCTTRDVQPALFKSKSPTLPLRCWLTIEISRFARSDPGGWEYIFQQAPRESDIDQDLRTVGLWSGW